MKVVNRRTFIAAKGHFEEAVALLHQRAQGSPFPTRVYRSQYGPFDMVALENVQAMVRVAHSQPYPA